MCLIKRIGSHQWAITTNMVSFWAWGLLCPSVRMCRFCCLFACLIMQYMSSRLKSIRIVSSYLLFPLSCRQLVEKATMPDDRLRQAWWPGKLCACVCVCAWSKFVQCKVTSTTVKQSSLGLNDVIRWMCSRWSHSSHLLSSNMITCGEQNSLCTKVMRLDVEVTLVTNSLSVESVHSHY